MSDLRFRMPLALLPGLAALLPAASGWAAESSLSEEVARVEEVRVYATPLRTRTNEIAQPTTVLSGEQLQRAMAPTLGETLSREPGINTSYFGPAVGRPVIRGLAGPRVRVLEDGIAAGDVSTTSDDHAVTVEPFLADQIEVLKGAATVLYGSGAIGGAVNTVTGRIPYELPEDSYSVRAQGSLGDVADERNAGLRADGRRGAFALHLDASSRTTDLYDVAGFPESDALRAEERAEVEGEEAAELAEEEAESFGTLLNSDLDTESLTFGSAWIGERARIGFAVGRFQTEYGLPGGHGHEHEHEEGEDHEDHEDGDEEEGGVRIEMDQTRYDFYGDVTPVSEAIDLIRFRGAWVDYRHQEIEGSGEIGSLFENQTFEGRLEILNAPIAGFQGALGLQYEDREFSAQGEEAFVVPVDRRTAALFVFQERAYGSLLLDVGARLENVDYSPSVGADTDFTVGSVALGGIFAVRPEIDLGFQFDLAQRAPDLEELYADGAHLATQTFEIGDPGLDEERAFNANAFVHGHFDAFDLLVNVYITDFSDFIYLQDTGQERDDLPVRRWTQGDARVTGAEFVMTVPLLVGPTLLDLRLTGDTVRAELDDAPVGGNDLLPRIPAARLGAALDFSAGRFEGEIGLVRVFRQDQAAAFETATDAYTDLHAHLGWHLDLERTHLELYLRGRNLLDVEQRLHTSFLKEQASLPGRALEAGVRVRL